MGRPFDGYSWILPENVMIKKRIHLGLLAVLLAFTINAYSQGIWYCNARHDIGKIAIYRHILPNFGGSNSVPEINCITGLSTPAGSCIYPKGSNMSYLGSGFSWVGGVLRGDTLVSSYTFSPFLNFTLGSDYLEFHPHEYPFGYITERSTLDQSSPEFKDAVSEQDFISVSCDTIPEGVKILPDFFHLRPHIPLNVEVTTSSYAWSLGYAEDFVIFKWLVRNIGGDVIHDAFIGIDMSVLAIWLGRTVPTPSDDLGGFISTVPSSQACGFVDSVLIMWSADNDGDPVEGEFVNRPTYDPVIGDQVVSARHVSAVELIAAPIKLISKETVSYNWWTFNQQGDLDPSNDIDFGPRHRGNYRNFHTGGIGAPFGDVNQYYIMGNGEIDYDPAYTAVITPYDQTWLYPLQTIAGDIADGTNLEQVMGIGPFDIPPGGEVPIVFAFVMGENFHTDPNNLQNLPYNPDAYYYNLDFSDLIRNAQVAKWIYDNPGVDTDKDGYRGEFHICALDSILDVDSNWIVSEAETTWYKGDGVPDWKPALPPPSPKMWVTPMYKGIHIRFNGEASENVRDIFTQLNDFEGFNVYVGRDEREQSFSLVASYDIENYDKYVWNYDKQPDPGWDLLEFPMTPEQIRCNYASSCDDSTFGPLSYRIGSPYVHPNYPESLLFWEKHLWNVSEFGVTSDIKKIYSNVRDPRTVPPDSLTPDDYTDDGYLKYFDYEITLENLLPTVGYYVSVTAFDFGWPKSRLEPLESSITDNAQLVYASLVDSALGEDYNKVIVYPNPYKLDDHYRRRGFEGVANDTRSNERVRRIHFANLPHKCTIKIFSLDGDLVREIHHDTDPNDPAGSHVEWGLVSKNGLAVVSGLYYWVVESYDGSVQMGKLAIIL